MKNPTDRILQILKRRPQITTSHLAKRHGISRQAAHQQLRRLVTSGHILKQGSSNKNAYYVLSDPHAKQRAAPTGVKWGQQLPTRGLREDEVFLRLARQMRITDRLNTNALEALRYTFTEILNNAIDHSGSPTVKISVYFAPQEINFIIRDMGIGIYQNIAEKKKLTSEIEGIQDLLKGKQTTMPKRHSGEGIFFTSKIADRFIIQSHRKKLTIDNKLQDVFLEDIRFKKGTEVYVEIAADTSTSLNDVFRQYSGEEFQFDRTKINIKLQKSEGGYISRSEAKRTLHGLEPFKEITLDFKGVDSIGQAFADEVFRVYQKEHPEKKLLAINTNENVEFMIRRVKPN